MQFESLLRERRSVRSFTEKQIDDDMVDAILEAANLAPSAGNLQAYEVVMVKDTSVRAALARAALNQSFVAQAPLVLVFFTNPRRSSGRYGERGRELYCIQDASAACAFAHLRAADLGLGSVWIGAFDDRAVSRAVNAPAELQPVAILPIGYPAQSPRAAPRRPLSNLVHPDRFG
ncbi:nitroreductase family protein [Planctomycetota bacterium]